MSDGVKLVEVNYDDFSKFRQMPVDDKGSKQYDYSFAETNNWLKFVLCHYSESQKYGILFMAWNTALRVYNINVNSKNESTVVLDQELLPPTGAMFTDAIPDHGRYWALTDNKQFVAFRPNNKTYDISIVELESKICTLINKYRSTIHLIC